MLLYGIHTSTDQQVMADIRQGQEQLQKSLDGIKEEDQQKLDLIQERLSQQSELIVRNFTFHWNLEMKKMEGECPNIFFITHASRCPSNFQEWLRHITLANLVSQEYRLCLVCQHPPAPHPVEGDGYPLRQAEEWWITISPWLNHLIKFLKFGIPMGKAIAEVYDEAFVKQIQNYIGLLEEITKNLSEASTPDSMDRSATLPIMDKYQYNEGPALRALQIYLDKVDPNHIWGYLYKTATPEGNILWLCNKHRQPYLVRPLKLEGII
jgi:internalin A